MKNFTKSKKSDAKSKKKQKPAKEQKPYIFEEGDDLARSGKVKLGAGMIIIAIILGFIGGFIVWGAFVGSMMLTDLLWHDGVDNWRNSLEAAGIPSWWLPVTITTLGGLLIGIWTKYTNSMPIPMEAVMKKIKKTGKYKLKNPFATIVSYLMPLVFGGAIGPEAGVTGLTSHVCTIIGGSLRRFGIKSKELSDVSVSVATASVFGNPLAGIMFANDCMSTKDLQNKDKKVDPYAYDMKKAVKIVTYAIAAASSALGAYVFTMLTGATFGFPRFDGLVPEIQGFWVVLICLVLGYLGAVCFHVSAAAFKTLSRKWKDKVVIKPVLCGLIIGTIAIFCPMVLFPGEEQLFELQEDWQTWSIGLLLATAYLKCAAATMCLNMGWDGGGIFPQIYAGAAIGYAISMITGSDPMFCVAISSAVLVSGAMRNIPIAVCLMLLAFPPATVVFTLLACAIGALAPMPGVKTCKRIEAEKEAEEEAEEKLLEESQQ